MRKEEVKESDLPPKPELPQELTAKKLPSISVEGMFPPAVIDDEIEGFSIGMRWNDTRGNEEYGCLFAKRNHAVWCSLNVMSFWFNAAVIATLCFAVLFNSIMLQLRVQTFGMWFYGIFITSHNDISKEVLSLRACFFFFLSLITCPLTPLFLIVRFRSPAEMLLNIRMIHVAAKN